MAKNDNLTDFLQDIADTIRAKRGITGPISAQNFATEINAIESGGTSTPDMPIIGDGKTYLYIKIAAEGRMTVPLYFAQSVTHGVTIDWGDGSAPSTLANTGKVKCDHTYAEIGEYTISLNPAEGCTLSLGHSSVSYCVMGIANEGKAYCNMLQAVEVGKNVPTISGYAFQYCYSLTSVVIPDSVTSISYYAFQYCYSLTSVVIPDSVTSLDSSVFYGCYSLTSVVIPDSVTSLGNTIFSECRSLASVVLPQGVPTISNYMFGSCFSLTSIVIPGNVTRIGNNTFNNCVGMGLYDFRASQSVPTMSSTNAFSGIPSDCRIVVPDSLYDTWRATTNWSTYASHIVKASEFNI